MDTYEAARAVFSRIQTIDPENASKIIAFILLQDQAEKEMIRLAFGPDNLIHSLINVAKTELGISSNTSSALISPISNPISISRPTPVFLPSPPSSPPVWSVDSNRSPSYAAVVNGAGSFSSPLGSSQSQDQNFSFLDDPLELPPNSFEFAHAFEQSQLALMRSNAAQQHRFAAAQFPYNRSAVATLMMGEELRKLNRSRMGCVDVNPASTQIYLTFPADSIFKEEDVSNYFSIFGPVQDVRIPYQQKRMFGFVSFVYPETVKIILAKGNPHFVCDSRVLVKPYKEKGKLPEKKRPHQQFDCGEPFEMHVGPRMYHGNQEISSREKLELEQEAEWQHAIELQSRRLMNLQLMDLKNHHRWQQNASVGSPPYSLNHHIHHVHHDSFEGHPTGSPTTQPQDEVNATSNGINKSPNHVLPESLFASEDPSVFTVKPIDMETPRQSENRMCKDNAKANKETESEDTG